MRLRRVLFPVFLLLILAGSLRLAGLDFGFPRLLHPDEPTAVRRVLAFARGSLNPRWFSMPSFYLYLLHFSTKALNSLGLAGGTTFIYLVGRTWSATLGTFTVILAFLTGRSLYGNRAGIGAALLLAVLPLHMLLSHYATVDVTVTFFIVLAFAAASRVLESGKPGWYLAGGIAAGLAAGTKYNGFLAVLPLAAAHFLAGKRRARGGWLGLALATAAAVFFLTTPFILGETEIFWRDLQGQSRYLMKTGHGPIFINTSPGLSYQLLYNLYHAGGAGFWLLAVAGAAGCLARRRREDWLLLAWIVPYLVLISIPTVKFARFLLPLLPFLCLGAGALLEGSPGRRRSSRWWGLTLAAVVFWNLVVSLGWLRTLAGPDPRIAANRWLRENLPAGARVGQIKTETGLVFLDDPPLHEPGLKAELVRYPRLLPALEDKPDYLVVSDFDYRQILRLGPHYDSIRRELWLAFLAEEKGYRLLRSFQRPPALGPLVFGGSFPPHDMKYNWPLVLVFARGEKGQ